MHNGWIKLYRKILQSPVFVDSKKLKLWVLCLLKATHTERKQVVGNQVIFLEKGQFVTGRVSLAVEYNKDVIGIERVSEQTLWRWMKFLEKEGMLSIKSTTKFSVITVLNWSFYQISEQEDESQMNNKLATNEQQLNTNKNEENVKKLKNVNKNNSQKSSTSDVDLENAHLLYELISKNYNIPEPNFDRWADHFRILRNKVYEDVSDDTIRYLIEFTQEDFYWQEIILSAEDFKVHYPRIYMCA
ncbi:hypothetical protein ACFVR1_13750 [Psychrobacillus sp. NPDC058041]|uniref:hypothetical protein n=1 Tax=Psychrobacillus sp. NPDC058041 TaxID=3346310 RepID=UPI0036DE9BDB